MPWCSGVAMYTVRSVQYCTSVGCTCMYPTCSQLALAALAYTCTLQKLQIGRVHAVPGTCPAAAVGTLSERCPRTEQVGGCAVLQTACRSELPDRRSCGHKLRDALYAATPSAAGAAQMNFLGLFALRARSLVEHAAWASCRRATSDLKHLAGTCSWLGKAIVSHRGDGAARLRWLQIDWHRTGMRSAIVLSIAAHRAPAGLHARRHQRGQERR